MCCTKRTQEEGYQAALQYNGEQYNGKILVVRPCQAPKGGSAAGAPGKRGGQAEAPKVSRFSCARVCRGYVL